jgi:hypothetical protein
MKHVPLACLLIGSLSPLARADSPLDRAVERGVRALRDMHEKGGGQAIGRAADGVNDMGRTALVGLTLLECGATGDDPLVRKIADRVRDQCADNNRVYNLSLAILLFDRLGDDRDVPLIQAMAVRLMEAQFKEGGWTYTTPDPDEKEVQRLKALIQKRAELRTGGDASGRRRNSDEPPPLDPDLADRLKRLGERGLGEHQAKLQNNPLGELTGRVDNSNTQFAIMGLWTARHHGIPADGSLRLCEIYFRSTHTNGTWPYSGNMEPYGRRAMTCAGLMGLAIGAGVIREAQMKAGPDSKSGKPPALKDPLNDAVVQAALNYVGDQFSRMLSDGMQGVPLDYYFVWSVERVGVTYSLSVIGGYKWHELGSTVLLLHQKPDGTWSNNYGPVIDSCFALMFLKRANLTRDLSSALAKKPSQPSLRANDVEKALPESKAAHSGEADKLRRELLTAAPARQSQILEQLRDGNGSDYTEALVTVIPELKGETSKKARDCLAERLVRMTTATVRDKLKDGRPEMRRAAALACAMKEEKAFVPDLIAVLDDGDAIVVRAAGVALRALTGQNFGPPVNATAEERTKAVAAWKAWWKQQKGK